MNKYIDTDKEDKYDDNGFIIITPQYFETIDRYGSANAEYIKAYTGTDQKTGTTTRLSHRKIYTWKNDFGKSASQQVGYSAEVTKVSRDNARNIINGESKRTIRTDDHKDYGVNHPIYDHIEIENGNVIDGSGSQMKFVNNIDKKLIDNIAKGEGGGKNDWSRYIDAKIDLPSDQLDSQNYKNLCKIKTDKIEKTISRLEDQDKNSFRKELNNIKNSGDEALKKLCKLEAVNLRIQADELEKAGQLDLAKEKRQQALNCEKVAKNIRDSGITTEEALFYREHPQLATLKDITLTSHEAGIEGLKNSALGAAGGSLARNIYAITKGELEIEDAVCNIGKDTAKAAAKGYAVTATSAALKGSMEQASPELLQEIFLESRRFLGNGQVSASEFLKIKDTSTTIAQKTRTLSGTAVPGLVVSVSFEILPLMKKFCCGEISMAQLTEQLGEKGASTVASIWGGSYGALLGTSILPGIGTIIGGIVGSLVSASITSVLYGSVLSDIRAARLAKQNLAVVKERYNRIHSLYTRAYNELEESFTRFFDYLQSEIDKSLEGMEHAKSIENIELFQSSANMLANTLNCKLSHSTFDDFKQHLTIRRK